MLTELLTALAAATPTPTPTIDPEKVTPGFAGFVAIAVVALAVVALLIDMLRRIRRAGYRAEIREQLDAEEAAQAPQDETRTGDDTDTTDGR